MSRIKITETQAKLLRNLSEGMNIPAPQPNSSPAPQPNVAEGDQGWFKEKEEAARKLIIDMYHGSDNIASDDIWVRNGLSWNDDIKPYLLKLHLIVPASNGFKLSNKIYGEPAAPEAVLQRVIKDLSALISLTHHEHKQKPEIDETNDMNDIWPNNPQDEKDAVVPELKNPKLYVAIAMNLEIAILKDAIGALYAMYWDEVDQSAFGDVARVTLDDITTYVNNNIKTMKIGVGSDALSKGDDLVKIDEPLKAELLNLYDKNKDIVNALTQLSEVTSAGSAGMGGSSGPFSGPLNMPIIKRPAVVAEGKIKKIITKKTLLEGVINELGMNDWKVKDIFTKLATANEMEYATYFKLITGKDINKSNDPRALMVLTLREMDKSDVDFIYNEIFKGKGF
jgi:hypothetical protein